MGNYLEKPNTEKHSFDGKFRASGDDEEELNFSVSEMQGWRTTMEDAHVARGGFIEVNGDFVSVFGVFDGHGGKEVADFCALHFVDEIVQTKAFQASDMETALRLTFHRMDDMLRDEKYAPELAGLRDQDESVSTSIEHDEESEGSGADGAALKESMKKDVKTQMDAAEQKGSLTKREALDLVKKMMKIKSIDEKPKPKPRKSVSNGLIGARYTQAGCTANICVIHGKKLYVANAGDTRAIMCSSGLSKGLSMDHKPRQPMEMNRIRNAGGWVNDAGRVNGNLNLSRSIGDLKYKVDAKLAPAAQIITAEPDVNVYDITSKDEFLFIGCDGIFDVMSNDAVVNFIKNKLRNGVKPHSAIIELLFENCITESPSKTEGLGADNMTGCLVLFKSSDHFLKKKKKK